MNNTLLIQLLLAEMERYGAEVTFAVPPQRDDGLWNALVQRQTSVEAAALDAIAAALREDTGDSVCIDRIIDILEPLGYTTTPRHDFG